MSIGEFPTVWIIGAGFSKALGGPLLADLSRPRHLTDLEKFVEGERLAIRLEVGSVPFHRTVGTRNISGRTPRIF